MLAWSEMSGSAAAAIWGSRERPWGAMAPKGELEALKEAAEAFENAKGGTTRVKGREEKEARIREEAEYFKKPEVGLQQKR